MENTGCNTAVDRRARMVSLSTYCGISPCASDRFSTGMSNDQLWRRQNRRGEVNFKNALEEIECYMEGEENRHILGRNSG